MSKTEKKTERVTVKMDAISEKAAFIYGFRLGMRFAAESLQGEKTIDKIDDLLLKVPDVYEKQK